MAEVIVDAPAEVEAPAQDLPAPETGGADPFAVDENSFASLSPEQRAALDPVLDTWKKSAKAALDKEKATYEPHVKKAQALESLTRDPRFVKWYHEINSPAQDPAQKAAAPAQVASAEEWANAVQEMANGDPTKFNNLQIKQLTQFAGPHIERLEQQQNIIRQQTEMNQLISNHPDVRDLDTIGREDDPTAPSLLELCLRVVKEQNRGTMEQAYQMAKKVAQSMENKGKRAAMGMVQEKKGSVTEKPATNSKEEGVILVDTMEEAMTKNIEAAMDGRKVKYSVAKK